jgi:hypothetical protein
MALTIKELEIRMRVGDEPEPAQGAAAQRAASDGGCEHVDKKEMVEDSVRRVLQALRNLEER